MQTIKAAKRIEKGIRGRKEGLKASSECVADDGICFHATLHHLLSVFLPLSHIIQIDTMNYKGRPSGLLLSPLH